MKEKQQLDDVLSIGIYKRVQLLYFICAVVVVVVARNADSVRIAFCAMSCVHIYIYMHWGNAKDEHCTYTFRFFRHSFDTADGAHVYLKPFCLVAMVAVIEGG